MMINNRQMNNDLNISYQNLNKTFTIKNNIEENDIE